MTKAYILEDNLYDLYTWSQITFGPGTRLKGVLKHINKEINEIEENPSEVEEWVDLIILAFDGALRQGYSGRQIIEAYHDKINVNKNRNWPDYTKFSQDEAIEHIRNEK